MNADLQRPRLAAGAVTLIAFAAIALTPSGAGACSPGGHAFVAIASLQRLSQSEGEAAQRLAHILRKYRGVVYWGAEGPDTVQGARGYKYSHLLPLFDVNYEHPELFDLEAAQAPFRAMLRAAYRVDYGVTPADIAEHELMLTRPPQPDWGEVSLAFACGYITHLISDYYCHHPAKVWWDHSPELQKAVTEVTGVNSYGWVQPVFAGMLWHSGREDYGLPVEAAEDFASKLPDYHFDNGVLPYCALAASREFYDEWPETVLELVDPSKYDGCAAPMIGHKGSGLGRAPGKEVRETLEIVKRLGLEMDEAIRISDDLTGWRGVYERVVEMIVTVWLDAAEHLDLPESNDEDVIAALGAAPTHTGQTLELGAEPGGRVNLALHHDWAAQRYRTRNGEEGPVTGWGEKPSGARFDLHVLEHAGRMRTAIVTDGPWLSAPGYVAGTFRLKLPDTDHPLRFRSEVRMFNRPKGSDGVTFRVEVTDEDGARQELFEQHVPSEEPVAIDVDLREFRGQTIGLTIISDCGPKDDLMRDWGAWVEPRVEVLGPQG